MPRPHDTERYELTDTEKRDLIALIEKGKPLPDRYRFLLFEDKREGELVWNGRTREVCTAVLPFQTLELVSAEHSCAKPGRYTVAVKVIDIFGNDTMTLLPVNVG
jgi:hypothetical protein